MLEWTGERFVPWVDDPALAYEHVHRYVFASRFAQGKRVLDLGSGEGYGSACLARTAQSVVGLDIDPDAVGHAERQYGGTNLSFVCGSVTAVPLAGPFDLIVCFETLEHIEDHGALVEEVRRLLAPDGHFVVSTPDKRAYSDQPHHDNPFHARELYFEEFRDLLGNAFPVVGMFAQRVSAGSRIWQLSPPASPDDETFEQIVANRSAGRPDARLEVAAANSGDPLYYLAVAGRRAAPVPGGSFFVDASGGLLEHHEQRIRELAEELRVAREEKAEAIAWKDSQIEALNVSVRGRDEALGWRESQVADLERAREAQELEAARYIGLLESTLGEKNEYIQRLEALLRSETVRADLAERTILRKTLDWLRGRHRNIERGGKEED